MLDVGWSELLVIAVILIVVVGPKDLPPMLRAFGKMTARFRSMAGDFRKQFDDALKETELDDVRRTIADARSLHPASALRDAIAPLRETANELRNDLARASAPAPAAAPAAPAPVETAAAVAAEPAPVAAAAPVAPVTAPAIEPAAVAVEKKPRAPRKKKDAAEAEAAPQPAATEAPKSKPRKKKDEA